MAGSARAFSSAVKLRTVETRYFPAATRTDIGPHGFLIRMRVTKGIE